MTEEISSELHEIIRHFTENVRDRMQYFDLELNVGDKKIQGSSLNRRIFLRVENTSVNQSLSIVAEMFDNADVVLMMPNATNRIQMNMTKFEIKMVNPEDDFFKVLIYTESDGFKKSGMYIHDVSSLIEQTLNIRDIERIEILQTHFYRETLNFDHWQNKMKALAFIENAKYIRTMNQTLVDKIKTYVKQVQLNKQYHDMTIEVNDEQESSISRIIALEMMDERDTIKQQVKIKAKLSHKKTDEFKSTSIKDSLTMNVIDISIEFADIGNQVRVFIASDDYGFQETSLTMDDVCSLIDHTLNIGDMTSPVIVEQKTPHAPWVFNGKIVDNHKKKLFKFAK